MLGFVSSGLIMTVLKAEGTEPVESDLLVMLKVGLIKLNSSLKDYIVCDLICRL